jgi:hypothetical protein
MTSTTTPDALVITLIDAENTRDRQAADDVLAADFTQITRARGVEQARPALLDELEKPANTGILRSLVAGSLSTKTSGDLAVVRSLVETRDAAQPAAAPGRFRNIHVFERQQNRWRCVIWQVTRVNVE